MGLGSFVSEMLARSRCPTAFCSVPVIRLVGRMDGGKNAGWSVFVFVALCCRLNDDEGADIMSAGQGCAVIGPWR